MHTIYMALYMALILAVLAIAPVRAQDGAITVIGEDGRIEVFDIPPETRKAVERAPQPRQAPPSVSAPAPVQEPVPEHKTKPEQENVPAAGTVPAPVTKPKRPEAEKVEEVQEAEETQEPAVVSDATDGGANSGWPPLPAHKPQPPTPEEREKARVHAVISERQAILIAIDYAPPSTDIRVMREMRGERRVYAVYFKTAAGPVAVAVDAVTGDVLK